MDTDDIKRVGQGLFVLLLLLVLVSQFFGVALSTSGVGDVTEDVILAPDNTGSLSYSYGVKQFEAEQSLGTTIRFSGANDSYLKGSADIPRDDTWSVATWAQLDDSVDTATATQRVLRFGSWLYVDVNQSAWRVTYYDESTLNTYQTSLNATAPQANWTHLTVQKNSSHLTVYRNNTDNTTIALTDGTTFNGSMEAGNLHGRVEETRVYDDELNSSQRDGLMSTPTHPLKANETARIYYDARAGETSVDVYRTGSDLEFSNVSVIDGFAGEAVSAGTDYERDGGTVHALAGGTLDGAPVAFAAYHVDDSGPLSLSFLVGIGGAAFSLLGIAILALATFLIISEVDKF